MAEAGDILARLSRRDTAMIFRVGTNGFIRAELSALNSSPRLPLDPAEGNGCQAEREPAARGCGAFGLASTDAPQERALPPCGCDMVASARRTFRWQQT